MIMFAHLSYTISCDIMDARSCAHLLTHIVSNVVYVVMINNREYNLIVKLAGRLPGDEDDDLSSPSSNSTGLHTPRQTSSRAKPPCLVTPMSLIQPRSNDDYDDKEVGWAVASRAISCKPNRLLLQPVTTSAASANVTLCSSRFTKPS